MTRELVVLLLLVVVVSELCARETGRSADVVKPWWQVVVLADY